MANLGPLVPTPDQVEQLLNLIQGMPDEYRDYETGGMENALRFALGWEGTVANFIENYVGTEVVQPKADGSN